MSATSVLSADSVGSAADLLRGRRFTVLSGAGISTESGIPDYRGEGTARRPRTPIQYREFVGSDEVRARYWARSAIGWPHMAAARPNAGHLALAGLERAGLVAGIITQNVDRLHFAAGSVNVIELHGAIAEAVCLSCGHIEQRAALQGRLTAMNPGWQASAEGIAPDGDADLPDALTQRFRVPSCLFCGGILKPNVVLFGENVPRPRVDAAFSMLESAEALVVAGSSLTVYSGLRFVDRAHRTAMPIVILNSGPTRGDRMATTMVHGRLGNLLPELASELARPRKGEEG